VTLRRAGAWALDFARADGTGGFVRLELRPQDAVAWYWAYVVGPGTGLVVVRDHEVPLPRAGLEVRAEGLWAELVCEVPGEHWSFGLEAFGVRLEDPDEALAPGGEVGERLPVGLDLEWDAGAVFGEILVGTRRIGFEGPGRLDVAGEPTDWWAGEWTRAWPGIPTDVEPPVSAVVPLGAGAVLRRALVRGGPGWWERLARG
jgi:hypothetical protein